MDVVGLKMASLAAAGIGAQWLAWRMKIPAIVLLLVAGALVGPVTGFIDPARDFGDIYRPAVSLAVAIILFEGGLTLNFKEISETSTAVRRLILLGGPLIWTMTALAAHYVGGLSWPTATVLGAILVVTGPTVIMPLLRQARLTQRPASLLRWEAIVNDAIGALFAVVAFEIFLVLHGSHQANTLIVSVITAFVAAVAGGIIVGRFIAWTFIRGLVPEYLKAPILFAAVLIAFVATNLILEEAGLLTVTVMGITLANTRIASLTEMRRFKETVTVLLVSALFVLLTAALDVDAIRALDWRAAAFVGLVMFVIRPAAVFLATFGTKLTWRERLLVAWIAPRGIVAVAVSGLFGAALADNGVEDASLMVAFAFAVVVTTIVAHGFTLSPLASTLGLRSAESPGVLIVGGSGFATSLARKLKELNVPVLIADTEWERIREARLSDIPVYFGEVLSEDAHHSLALNRYQNVIAATPNDAYNTLVCTDLGPEVGRSHVFQIGSAKERSERLALNFTLGGRPLTREPALGWFDFQVNIARGWGIQATRLSEEFTFDKYLETRAEGTRMILWRKPSGQLVFASTTGKDVVPQAETVILSFAPPKADGQARSTRSRQDEKEPQPDIRT
ncbi:sodium:proton exchanger [Zhengella mangrovi]|uniref:Sodium:proton exchanger n=1 Tax=Zhengella mangrovi TaxID=1982044 RepID=A0A2G1QQ10_9HYPH|nr:sodium:proton antiporter [Zhengella mangrovi]PHP67575.1 sodium:proton exchanger [Zhengella mangrovi]